MISLSTDASVLRVFRFGLRGVLHQSFLSRARHFCSLAATAALTMCLVVSGHFSAQTCLYWLTGVHVWWNLCTCVWHTWCSPPLFLGWASHPAPHVSKFSGRTQDPNNENTNFGQSRIGQSRVQPKGGEPAEGWEEGSEWWWGRMGEGWGSVFCLSSAPNFALSCLSGVFSLNFGPGSRPWPTQMVRLGFSELILCELQRPQRPPSVVQAIKAQGVTRALTKSLASIRCVRKEVVCVHSDLHNTFTHSTDTRNCSCCQCTPA